MSRQGGQSEVGLPSALSQLQRRGGIKGKARKHVMPAL